MGVGVILMKIVILALYVLILNDQVFQNSFIFSASNSDNSKVDGSIGGTTLDCAHWFWVELH